MTPGEYNRSVDLYSDSIYRFVLKNLKDEETSHDVVQDTYEKLWVNHSRVDGSKVKSYLFSTAYHTLIDLLRRQKKQAAWSDAEAARLTCHNSYSDLNEQLHEALAHLPESQRMVLMLRDYEGYTYEEIGEITGLTESQVKVYIYRARVFLKSYIGKIEVLL